MSEGAKILRGPWRRLAEPAAPPEDAQHELAGEGEVGSPNELGAGRMHLGFVVRECSVALGREPTPQELADWANHQADERGEYCLFGRKITAAEARVILRHPGRAVSVRPERARPRAASGTPTA